MAAAELRATADRQSFKVTLAQLKDLQKEYLAHKRTTKTQIEMLQTNEVILRQHLQRYSRCRYFLFPL